jgi:hypothetical protein
MPDNGLGLTNIRLFLQLLKQRKYLQQEEIHGF